MSFQTNVKYFELAEVPFGGIIRVVDSIRAPDHPVKAGGNKAKIEQLQQALAYLGHLDYKGVDGAWGPVTTKAFKEFQRANGLKADGAYGPKSAEALRIALGGGASAPAPAPTPAPPPPRNDPPAVTKEEPPKTDSKAEEKPAPPPEPAAPPRTPSTAPERAPGECAACDVLQRAVADGKIGECRKDGTNETLIKAMQQHFFDFHYYMGATGDEKNGVDGGYGATSVRILGRFREEVGLSTRSKSAESLLPEDVEAMVEKCKAGFRTQEGDFPGSRTDEVPFAPLPTGTYYYPLLKRHAKNGTMVSRGEFHRSGGRYFGAIRGRQSDRVHVGVDLWAEWKDEVIACESGTVVGWHRFVPFERDGIKGHVYALLVENDSGTVINYGEVDVSSKGAFKWKNIGDRVEAGEVIAIVGKMNKDSMLHFETYASGTKATSQWFEKNRPPSNLLDPTRYLLEVRKRMKS